MLLVLDHHRTGKHQPEAISLLKAFNMKKPSAVGNAHKPRILLVDSNPHGLTVRKALLEDEGFSVQTAASGEGALQLFNASAFDVVVTSFRLPGMTGSELIRKIRQQSPDARAILLSGFVELLGLTEGTAADMVLEKSSREGAELVRSVRRLLRLRRHGSHSAASEQAVRAAGRSGFGQTGPGG